MCWRPMQTDDFSQYILTQYCLPVFARSASKSHIATPVVSLPVPAVVGTMQTTLHTNTQTYEPLFEENRRVSL